MVMLSQINFIKIFFKNLINNYIKIKFEKYWISNLLIKLISLFILVLISYKYYIFYNSFLELGFFYQTNLNSYLHSHIFTKYVSQIIIYFLSILFFLILVLFIFHGYFSLNAILKDYLRNFNLKLYWFVYFSIILFGFNLIFFFLPFFSNNYIEFSNIIFFFYDYIYNLLFENINTLNILWISIFSFIYIIFTLYLFTWLYSKNVKMYYYEKILFLLGFIFINIHLFNFILDLNNSLNMFYINWEYNTMVANLFFDKNFWFYFSLVNLNYKWYLLNLLDYTDITNLNFFYWFFNIVVGVYLYFFHIFWDIFNIFININSLDFILISKLQINNYNFITLNQNILLIYNNVWLQTFFIGICLFFILDSLYSYRKELIKKNYII